MNGLTYIIFFDQGLSLIHINKVITHFAARSGAVKASKIRLYIDLFSFLTDIYGYICKIEDVLSQVNAIDNDSLLTARNRLIYE